MGEGGVVIYNTGVFMNAKQTFCMQIENKKIHKHGVPLWHNRLRIRHCHCSGSGHCFGPSSIPGSGPPCAMGMAKRKKQGVLMEGNNRTYQSYVGILQSRVCLAHAFTHTQTHTRTCTQHLVQSLFTLP